MNTVVHFIGGSSITVKGTIADIQGALTGPDPWGMLDLADSADKVSVRPENVTHLVGAVEHRSESW